MLLFAVFTICLGSFIIKLLLNYREGMERKAGIFNK